MYIEESVVGHIISIAVLLLVLYITYKISEKY